LLSLTRVNHDARFRARKVEKFISSFRAEQPLFL